MGKAWYTYQRVVSIAHDVSIFMHYKLDMSLNWYWESLSRQSSIYENTSIWELRSSTSENQTEKHSRIKAGRNSWTHSCSTRDIEKVGYVEIGWRGELRPGILLLLLSLCVLAGVFRRSNRANAPTCSQSFKFHRGESGDPVTFPW